MVVNSWTLAGYLFFLFSVVVVAETRDKPGISTHPRNQVGRPEPFHSTTNTMSPITTINMVGDAEKDPMLAELGTTDRDGINKRQKRNPFILALLPLLGTLFLLTTFRSTCWSSPDTTTILTTTSPNNPPGVFIPNGLRPAVHSRSPQTAAVPAPTSSAPPPQRTVLQCFEVDQPVLLPDGAAESDGSSHEGKTWNDEDACTVLLMRRDFAWSYEDPFIGISPFPFIYTWDVQIGTKGLLQPNTPHPPAPSTASSSTSPPSPKGVNTTGSPSWYPPFPLPPPPPTNPPANSTSPTPKSGAPPPRNPPPPRASAGPTSKTPPPTSPSSGPPRH